MKSIARFGCLLALIVPVSQLHSQEQIAWVADVATASAMAAEQRRLVLLHFYSDNCEPCVRLEQNVFSQAEVAQAVAHNFLAVKVHAGKNPQLAARYRVNRWPTDVFVTPSGLEIYRTISPQKPGEYIAVLNQVAQQTGIGSARQWQSPLDQVVRPVAAEAAIEAGHAAQAVNAVTGQMQQAVGQGQQSFQQVNQQAADLAQRGASAANQLGQDANSAVQRYGQQANNAQQQVRQQVAETRGQLQQQAVAAQTEAQATAQRSADQFGQAASQASQQINQTAQGFGQSMQQAIAATGFDRRSSFMAPAEAGAPTPQTSTAQPSTVEVARPAAAAPVPPANNPWIKPAPAEASYSAASAAPPLVAPVAAPPAATQPPVAAAATTVPPSTSSTPPAAPVAAPTLGSQQLVPASQAPPIGLDGFCPVTLLETVARDPSDRSAWKKGDKQFGAIHRGRTYLFGSAEHQNRFLANPDAFAPVLAGCDPVRFADRGEMIDGKRAYGLVTPDRRIYLFADEASRNRFEQAPANYSNAIQQALLRSEAGGVYR